MSGSTEQLKELVGYDPFSGNANLQHVFYLFMGYRDYMRHRDYIEAGTDQEDNPFSPGSARARSWHQGFRMAENND